MAVKFFDGFDHYAIGQILRMWTAQSGVAFATGRDGVSNGVNFSANTDFLRKTLASSHASGVCGFAWKASVVTGTLGSFFEVMAGSTVHINLSLNASQQIIVERAETTTLCTGTTVLSPGTWYYIEVKWTIDDAAGSVEVRLNGSGTAECSASNVDTRNGATADWNTISLERTANTGSTTFDDLYLLDGDAAGANDFLGDRRVLTLAAQAGNGSNVDFTPSTGSDHGALVDDATPDDDTTYNAGTAAGQKDSYHHADLSVVPLNIDAVMVCPCVRKTDAGARSTRPILISGATEDPGTTSALSTSYLYYPDIWEEDPDTAAAWDIPGVNGIETGLEVVV